MVVGVERFDSQAPPVRTIASVIDFSSSDNLSVHVSVPCTVCHTSKDLLSLNAMLEAGWSFMWPPEGHYVDIPAVKRFPLSVRPGGMLAYIDLVLLPRHRGGPKGHYLRPRAGRRKCQCSVRPGMSRCA